MLFLIHNKQQANSTTVHSNDHTDHSIADTLPMYTSNSVHHMPMETAPSPESTTILISLLSTSCSTAGNSCYINVASGDGIIHSNGSSYTVNMAHVTYQCLQAISGSNQSIIDGGATGGLAGTGVHMLEYTEQYADIMGVGQASINTLSLVTCAGMIHMTQGFHCSHYESVCLLWKGEYSPFSVATISLWC